jgi:hypothetical protein
MNYKKIYHQLCDRSLTRKWAKFTYEKHHIIPKSLGGKDIKSNLAILTPREHALAHRLLVRFLTGTDKAKMIYALKSMVGYRNTNRQQLTSRQYDFLKKEYQTLSKTPEYSEWRSSITKAQWTPERKAAVSAKSKEQWKTGPKRQVFGSDEYRLKKSKQTKERWSNPDYAKKQSEWTKAQWQDPTKRPGRKRLNETKNSADRCNKDADHTENQNTSQVIEV